MDARFIELAGTINSQMPQVVVDRIQDALNDRTKSIRGSKIHLMGVAYKKDIDDFRESPALDVIHLLKQRGAIVTYSDPYIPEISYSTHTLRSMPAELGAENADCVVILADHATVDHNRVAQTSKVIIDTRNALKNYAGSNKYIL